MQRHWYLGAAALAVCLAAEPLAAQDMHKHGGHHPRFEYPETWAKRFDNPARDAWQMPDRIVESLALKPADSVADIGTGTGYMAMHLARAVPEGHVFAVDVEPGMVGYTAMRASTENLRNLRGVIGDGTSPRLPEPVDVAFLLNTYHQANGLLQEFACIAEARRACGHCRLPPRRFGRFTEAHALLRRANHR